VKPVCPFVFWGRLSVSVMQTLLYFVGIPVAVVLLVAAAVYAGGARRSRRYRPGRPFDFTPVWFLSYPGTLAHADGAHALPAADRPALPHATKEGEWPGLDQPQSHVTGGASDRW
jgi:hypothetical protein